MGKRQVRLRRGDGDGPIASTSSILSGATFPSSTATPVPGPQPLSGDGQTVKQVGTHFGPSERLTVDFSDLDNSTLDIVNGQSGDIFDEHYNDQWDAYYHGRTFPLPFSLAAVQRAGVHHLKLEP